MNRDDFEILNTGVIYFDNGATTLKPKKVLASIEDYYNKYTANAHRGDYDNSLRVDTLYENTRIKVKNLIGADRPEEIVFTKGTTESLNMIVFGFMKNYLKKGDEILITKAEHASNVLPWLELEKSLGVVIKYIPLDNEYKLTMDNLLSKITDKTKVISIAHITNTIGDERPIKEIGKLCKEKNIYFVLDCAQSIPHKKISVKDLNVSFLAFSGHKMCAGTGVGVLYGKYELLDKLIPLNYGGGMNSYFEENLDIEYKSLPTRLEAGTPNIEGVISLGSAIDYLESIGFNKIESYEKDLRKYLVDKLSLIPNVTIYNKNINTGIVLFNLNDVFAQDTAVYLNNYHICVRAGNHCTKMLKDELGIKNTCRISLYFYNTKEEIDRLIDVLEKSENIFKEVL